MIREQITLVLAMFLTGMAVMFAYDILLVGRAVIRRSVLWTAIEDIVYWSFAAVFTFCIVYKINEGVSRGYAAVGFTVGALLFQWGIGSRIVELLTHFVNNTRNYLKKIFNWCRMKISFQKKN